MSEANQHTFYMHTEDQEDCIGHLAVSLWSEQKAQNSE